jgi:hypothetical protein
MYTPLFNSVVVELQDEDDKWGKGNDDSMLGKSYRKGVVVSVGLLSPDHNHPLVGTDEADEVAEYVQDLIGKEIMYNEGAEAGTEFEHDDKQYGMIYWWDIRGVKDGK